MNSFTILLIAVGLAMDAFAVSIASGLTMTRFRIRYVFRIALAFGLFQAIMPIIGFLAGLSIRDFLASIDHWVAFGMLSFIGCKMIYESISMDSNNKQFNPQDLLLILSLAVATSIDALAVGISLSFLKISIIRPALIIGIVTFAFSFTGVYIGKRIGHLFEKKIEIIGGLILIGIGIRILIEHLFFT